MRRRVAALAVIAALAGVVDAQGAGTRMVWRVASLDGGWISHEDFKGRVVVLDLWAIWCEPCRMVTPHLVDLHRDFRSRGMSVLGLSVDVPAVGPAGEEDLDAVRAYVREFGIDYPIGLMNAEAQREIARVMGTGVEGVTIPTTIIIDRNGRVVRRYSGYFEGQEKEIRVFLEGLLGKSEAAGSVP